MSSFPQNLKSLRESRGITQEALGRRVGVAKSTISMYETGSREPGFQILEALAAAFHVPLSALVGDPAAPGLAPDEARLIAGYRSLNPEGKQYVFQSVRLARLARLRGSWTKKR